MSIEENVQIVKDFFSAMGGDKQGLLALSAEDSLEHRSHKRKLRWRKRSVGILD